MSVITTKLEISIDKNEATHPDSVADFAKKNKIRSIVVDPEMFYHYFVARTNRRGTYTLGMTVDFPKGNKQGAQKVVNLPEEAMEADFFDVLISANNTVNGYVNEIKLVRDFLKGSINKNADVRIVVNHHHRTPEAVGNAIKAASQLNCKTIRTNHFVEGTKNTRNAEAYDFIKSIDNSMKVVASGDVSLRLVREYVNKIDSFVVSYNQARKIVGALASNDLKDAIVVEEDIEEGDYKKIDVPAIGTEEDVRQIVSNSNDYMTDDLKSVGATFAFLHDRGKSKLLITVPATIDITEVPETSIFEVNGSMVEIPCVFKKKSITIS